MAKDVFTAEWFPYYLERFEGSDRVAAMSLAEEGAYHRAIRIAWKYGSVPSDPKLLAAKIQKRCTVKIGETVLATFEPMPGNSNRMIHPVVEEIRQEQEKKYLNRVKGGKAAAENRSKQTTSSISPAELEQQSSSYRDRDKEEEKKRTSEAEVPKEKTAPVKKIGKAFRIPDPFPITPEMWAWLAENIPNLDNPNAAHADWVEHWTNSTGPKAEKINWTLTWQKGMRNAKKWQDEDRQNGTTNRPTSEREKSAARTGNALTVIDELRRQGREEEQALSGGSNGAGAPDAIALEHAKPHRG